MNKTLVAASLAVLLNGCATIMNDSFVSVPVKTTPSGATVTVNGASYTSPAIASVPRGEGDFNLHIEKEGYQAVDVLLKQSKDGWLWGNLLVGGLIGLAIDFATGDAYDLDPEMVSASLENASFSRAKDGTLHFVLIDLGSLPPKMAERVKARATVGG